MELTGIEPVSKQGSTTLSTYLANIIKVLAHYLLANYALARHLILQLFRAKNNCPSYLNDAEHLADKKPRSTATLIMLRKLLDYFLRLNLIFRFNVAEPTVCL